MSDETEETRLAALTAWPIKKKALDSAIEAAKQSNQNLTTKKDEAVGKRGALQKAQEDLAQAAVLRKDEVKTHIEEFRIAEIASSEADSAEKEALEANNLATAALAEKQGEFDEVDRHIKEIFGDGVNITELVAFAGLLEDALAQAKIAIDERDDAAKALDRALKNPVEIQVVKDPTLDQLKALLKTEEGKKCARETDDYRAIKNERDALRKGLETVDGLEELLKGEFKNSLEAFLLENAPEPVETVFDPTKISKAQLIQLLGDPKWKQEVISFLGENEKGIDIIKSFNVLYPPKKKGLAKTIEGYFNKE